MWKVLKDMTTQWPIELKDQLDSRGIFIDATLDPIVFSSIHIL